MSKLFSCFWKNKKEREYSPQESAWRSGRQSRENNGVVYIETGGFIDKDAGNLHKFNGNVRTVYRTETVSQTPQHEKLFGLDKNELSRSYPVSPERRPLYKVYSFEQRPSFEKQRLMTRRDSKNKMTYADNVTANTPQFNQTIKDSDTLQNETPVVTSPRRSVLSYDAEYEKESLVSNERPICQAEKPAVCQKGSTPIDRSGSLVVGNDNDGNIQENVRYNALRISKEGNEDFFLRRSDTANKNILHLAGDSMRTDSKIKTVVRLRPQSSKSSPGSSVKIMAYRAEDVYRSPMMTRKYVVQKPVRGDKQPPILTTPDGRVLMPLTPVEVKKLSTSSNKENKPVGLSVRPLETDEGFLLAEGGKKIVAAPMIRGGGVSVEGFPMAKGQEMIIAAPMIGGREKGKKGGKAQKSILRKGKGSKAQTRTEPDDYYDDYSDEYDYGERNYRQPYYDDGPDMYSSAPYHSPMDGPYGSRRGYYDDGYGYVDESPGGYGRPMGYPRGGRSARPQIYAAQIPDITLPTTSTMVDRGKNPRFKKTSKSLDATETCGNIDYSTSTNEKPEHAKLQVPKDSKVQLMSSAQQTDPDNDLDFICFSPERFLKAAEAPDDPNSKLRWRILIKRGDDKNDF